MNVRKTASATIAKRHHSVPNERISQRDTVLFPMLIYFQHLINKKWKREAGILNTNTELLSKAVLWVSTGN